MDLETALAQLKRRCAASTAPTLCDQTLLGILRECRTVDEAGLLVDDPEWAGAWDMNLAEALAWETKEAAVAGEFDFSADGGSYKRSQQAAAFAAKAKAARMRRSGGIGEGV